MFLVRQRAAVKRGGLAKRQAICQRDLRRKSVGGGWLARKRRIGERRIEFMRPRETAFVDKFAIDGRSQSHIHSVDVHDVVTEAGPIACYRGAGLKSGGRESS